MKRLTYKICSVFFVFVIMVLFVSCAETNSPSTTTSKPIVPSTTTTVPSTTTSKPTVPSTTTTVPSTTTTVPSTTTSRPTVPSTTTTVPSTPTSRPTVPNTTTTVPSTTTSRPTVPSTTTTVPSTTTSRPTVPSTTTTTGGSTTTTTTIPSVGPVVLEETTIFLVGDSTVCSFADSYYYPRYGYGTQIYKYLDSKAIINNLALSGRSSKSFLLESNYTTLKNSISEGDYLVIGFGHNDEKSDDSTRFTDASKPITDTTSFKYSLNEYYIKIAKEAGATPILCTPIVRANKTNDYTGSSAHVTSTGNYAEAIRELGQEVDVDVIDLTAITKAKYTELGYSEALYYHAMTAGKYDTDETTIIPNIASVDATHLNIYGAKYVAYSFATALLQTNNSLKYYVLDGISAPTKEIDLVANSNYKVSVYAAPNLTNYSPNSVFSTITTGWYGTAFGDTGGDPIGKGFTAKETSVGVFKVGNANASGKITTTEGISFLFKQVSKNDNFIFTADVEIISDADTAQAGFGLMLRDDCYLPIKDSSILSNYVTAGMYIPNTNKTAIIYSRENSVLTSPATTLSTAYQSGDTASLKIERIGQVVNCTVVYKGTTYTKTYTDFDFIAIDNDNMYVGMYATRGTIAEFTNVVYTYTGESQGA